MEERDEPRRDRQDNQARSGVLTPRDDDHSRDHRHRRSDVGTGDHSVHGIRSRESRRKSIADAFNLARAQAIRTGNVHLVYFDNGPVPGAATDIAGTAIRIPGGQPTQVLVVDDGAPGSANQNCAIDPAEPLFTFEQQIGVNFGSTLPTVIAPDELLLAIPANGSSFRQPNAGAVTNRVAFRPDGVPVAFDNFCTQGRLGSGGGTIYLTTTNRDFAITLSPLGAVRVHTWDVAAGAWTI